MTGGKWRENIVANGDAVLPIPGCNSRYFIFEAPSIYTPGIFISITMSDSNLTLQNLVTVIVPIWAALETGKACDTCR